MKTKYIFQRVEKKYLLSKDKYEKLMQTLDKHIVKDTYGLTKICNIYFDTNDDELIRYSLEKPVYKEKLRLRSYGIPTDDSKVFLEIKKKYNGVVYKRRVAMTYKEANDYLGNGIKPSCDTQILNEIDFFIHNYNVVPKMFLAYDRVAYQDIEDPELRITFDRNIRSRRENLDLKYGDNGKQLIDDEYYLMEIKVNSAMPMWLADALCENNIYPVSFSKYGNFYRKELTMKAVDTQRKTSSVVRKAKKKSKKQGMRRTVMA